MANVKLLTANRGLPFVVRSPNLDLKVSIVYIAHLPKFANTSPLRLLSSGKLKTEKYPWIKEKKQTSPKKEGGTHFRVGRKTKTPF